jgi:hypothetical protein
MNLEVTMDMDIDMEMEMETDKDMDTDERKQIFLKRIEADISCFIFTLFQMKIFKRIKQIIYLIDF